MRTCFVLVRRSVVRRRVGAAVRVLKPAVLAVNSRVLRRRHRSLDSGEKLDYDHFSTEWHRNIKLTYINWQN